jgi:hypothetical protein
VVTTPPDAGAGGRRPGPLPEPHHPLTTKEGWQQFVEEGLTADGTNGSGGPATADSQPPPGQVDAEELLRTRLDYHARLVVVATPTVRAVIHTGRRLVLLNRHQHGAGAG